MTYEDNRPAHPARDEAAMKYLHAIDRDDLDALANLWDQAETDPELAQTFQELNQGLLEEGNRPEWGGYRRDVLVTIERHLPQALDPQPLPPLTVGDVAARIVSDPVLVGRLIAADRDANEQLIGDRTPVPERVTDKSLAALAAGLTARATVRYWREFQQVAVMLSMSRGHAVARAAARDAWRRRSASSLTRAHEPSVGDTTRHPEEPR